MAIVSDAPQPLRTKLDAVEGGTTDGRARAGEETPVWSTLFQGADVAWVPRPSRHCSNAVLSGDHQRELSSEEPRAGPRPRISRSGVQPGE